MLGNLFQQFYNMADTIIVGKFVGKMALSAVGSVGPLNFLVIGSILGLCTGFAIPIAQSFGAQDFKKLRKITANIIYTSIVMGILLTILVVVFAKPLLRILNTPHEIFDDAYNYIVIIFLGIGATMLYNIVSSIIRSLGDSKTPLYFLVFSSFLNIGLDLLLIIVFKMGVRGAAIATVISQAFSAIAIMRLLIKENGPLNFSFKKLKVDFDALKEILKIGLPSGIQSSLFSISNVVVQTSVNGFGSTIMAANAAAANLESFVYVGMNSVYQYTMNFTSQNYGAKKEFTDRVPISELYERYRLKKELILEDALKLIPVNV
jgi:putative MATE family efflux protein